MPNPYIIYTLIDDDNYHQFIIEQILQIEKGSKLTGKGRLSFDQAMQVITNKYKEGEFIDIQIKGESDEDEGNIQVIMDSELDSDIEEPYFIETKVDGADNRLELPNIDKKNVDIILIVSSSVARSFMPEISALKGYITEVIIIYKDGDQLSKNVIEGLKTSYIASNELITYLNALLNDKFPYQGVEINGIDINQEVTGELLGDNNF